MQRKCHASALLAVMAVLAATSSAGCSSGGAAESASISSHRVSPGPQSESPAASSSDETATGGSPADLVYALASHDVDELKSAARLVVPGSPAAIYVQHQANLAEADVDGGDSLDPEEVSGNGGKFELCVTDHRCDTFTRFEQDGSGRVASFWINGFDIAPRLRRGDGVAVRSAGAKFTFLTSYRPATRVNIGYFVVRVDSGENPLLINVSTMKYRDPSGKRGYISDWGGPRMLDAHSSALIYSAFRGIRPGGGITLDGCLDGCNRRYQVKIKT